MMVDRKDWHCRRCKIALVDFDEIEMGICEDCILIEIERSSQRANWEQFHEEPCPEVELTPFTTGK